MRALGRIFISWLPLAVAVTGLSLLCYVVAQQAIRQSFNDISVQMAEDTVALLEKGVSPDSLTSDRTVNIRTSIAPFFIVYNKDGKVIGGNGLIDGTIPTPPEGVFKNIDFWRWGHSWQPDTDVRIDAAIIPYSSTYSTGYVLGGRNMRLMEDHIFHVGALVLQAWIILLIGTLLAQIYTYHFSKP